MHRPKPRRSLRVVYSVHTAPWVPPAGSETRPKADYMREKERGALRGWAQPRAARRRGMCRRWRWTLGTQSAQKWAHVPITEFFYVHQWFFAPNNARSCVRRPPQDNNSVPPSVDGNPTAKGLTLHSKKKNNSKKHPVSRAQRCGALIWMGSRLWCVGVSSRALASNATAPRGTRWGRVPSEERPTGPQSGGWRCRTLLGTG